MSRGYANLLGFWALATLLLGISPANAHGPGGGHGGYHGGGFGYGGFYYGSRYPAYGLNGFPFSYGSGLYAPYGYFRPYYGYGLGGIGLGGVGLGGYGYYRPYYASPVIVAPGVTPPNPAVAPIDPTPPSDNAAHLQLIVPENAEVLFDGGKTQQTGTTREFVSPPLPPGKVYSYTITVRSTDANGKTNVDKRVINVQANDWFRIDFTRPAPE
jgi:uncharacterized protein (TIGR03000 family)